MTTDQQTTENPGIQEETNLESLLETTPTRNVFFIYTTRMALNDGILYEPYPKTCPGLYLSMRIFKKIHELCRELHEDTDDMLREIITDIVANTERLNAAIKSSEAVLFDTRIGRLQLLTNELKGATIILENEY